MLKILPLHLLITMLTSLTITTSIIFNIQEGLNVGDLYSLLSLNLKWRGHNAGHRETRLDTFYFYNHVVSLKNVNNLNRIKIFKRVN